MEKIGVSGVCPGGCSGHGICTDNGMCDCEQGYTGVDCSTGTSFPVLKLWSYPSKNFKRFFNVYMIKYWNNIIHFQIIAINITLFLYLHLLYATLSASPQFQ